MKRFLIACLFLLLSTSAYGQGCDSNTQLLLHFDGDDEATTTTDENCDGSGAHVVTFVSAAELDTAIKKFGSASLLLPGTGDWLTIPDSADWDLVGSTADYTVDMWVYPNSLGGEDSIAVHEEGGLNFWSLRYKGGGLSFRAFNETLLVDIGAGGVLTLNVWAHVALIKKVSEYGIYLDGTQVGYTSDSDTDTYAGLFKIGTRGGGDEWDGQMDEYRVQKSNYFSASPNSTPDDTITVPTVAYSVASSRGRLMIISKIFTKRKDSPGYDRHVERHWYTNKDTKVN